MDLKKKVLPTVGIRRVSSISALFRVEQSSGSRSIFVVCYSERLFLSLLHSGVIEIIYFHCHL